MVKFLVQTQAPRHNEGGTSNGEGGNVYSTQLEDLGNPVDHEIATESLKVDLQHKGKYKEALKVRKYNKVHN